MPDLFEVKNIFLDFRYFPPPHNQHTTRNLALTVLKEFIVRSRVRRVTTDSGCDMAPALAMVREKLNVDLDQSLPADWHLRYACHIVGTAVKSTLRSLSSELGNVTHGIKSIRRIQSFRQKFRKAQVLLEYKQCKEMLDLDVETCWSSTFTCLSVISNFNR